MFDQLGSLISKLKSLVADLAPDGIDGDTALTVLGLGVEVERIGASLRLLAAGRVAATEVWRRGGARSAADWMSRQAGVSPGRAGAALEAAERLRKCPLVASALRSGAISDAQAELLVDAAAARPEAEEELVRFARAHSWRQLRQECRRVKTLGEHGEDEHDRVRRNRELRRWVGRDGAVCVSLRMAPGSGALFLAALDARTAELIRHQGEEREPFGALAADALVELVTEPRGEEAGRSRPGATVIVHVDYEALVRGRAEPGDLCEISGIGPVPVSVVERLRADAILRVLVTKGGQPYAVTCGVRTIPVALRKLLEARDTECCVPGCDVTKGLQIHHYVVDFRRDGPTSLENCARLCRRHHDMASYDAWRLRGGPGAWEWLAPDDYRDPEPFDPDQGIMVAYCPWTGRRRDRGGADDEGAEQGVLVGAAAPGAP